MSGGDGQGMTVNTGNTLLMTSDYEHMLTSGRSNFLLKNLSSTKNQ